MLVKLHHHTASCKHNSTQPPNFADKNHTPCTNLHYLPSEISWPFIVHFLTVLRGLRDLKHHHNIFQVGLCYGSGRVVTAQHFILNNIFFHHLLASDSLQAGFSYSCGIWANHMSVSFDQYWMALKKKQKLQNKRKENRTNLEVICTATGYKWGRLRKSCSL